MADPIIIETDTRPTLARVLFGRLRRPVAPILPAVLAANPGLADHATGLPRGTVIAMPDAAVSPEADADVSPVRLFT